MTELRQNYSEANGLQSRYKISLTLLILASTGLWSERYQIILEVIS